MLNLPPRFAELILSFAPVFVQQRTWHHAKLLLLGALLTPGQRTVCSILRIVGLRRETHFVNYHRILNRAVWHSRLGARLLLDRLLRTFVPNGPVLLATTPLSVVVASRSVPRAFIAIRCAPHARSLSRPADYAG